jgi:hypothetical protein
MDAVFEARLGLERALEVLAVLVSVLPESSVVRAEVDDLASRTDVDSHWCSMISRSRSTPRVKLRGMETSVYLSHGSKTCSSRRPKKPVLIRLFCAVWPALGSAPEACGSLLWNVMRR